MATFINMSAKIRSKRPRLKIFSYKGLYRYSTTICTQYKKKLFIEDRVVELSLAALKRISVQEEFIVWAYCFMPDHLHLLIEGMKENSDMKRFVSRFKQKSGYEFKKKYGLTLWQKSYYDHVLRREEDLLKACYYIWANPLRKGLVENWKDYPYSGSFVEGVWEGHR